MGWERARKPAQKEQRRRDILDAAATLFDEGGLDAASLTAIGKRAGLSKANLYRYFGSREAILLALLAEEQDAWIVSLERDLALLGPTEDLPRLASVLAGSFDAHPRMCALLPVAPTVLENNVTLETAAAMKRKAFLTLLRVVNALHATLPRLGPDGARQVVTAATLCIGSVWAHTHPVPVIRELAEDDEFAWLRVAFRPMLEEQLRLILRGVLADQER